MPAPSQSKPTTVTLIIQGAENTQIHDSQNRKIIRNGRGLYRQNANGTKTRIGERTPISHAMRRFHYSLEAGEYIFSNMQFVQGITPTITVATYTNRLYNSRIEYSGFTPNGIGRLVVSHSLSDFTIGNNAIAPSHRANQNELDDLNRDRLGESASVVITTPQMLFTNVRVGQFPAVSVNHRLQATSDFPVTWTIVDGNLPNWLSLSPEGVLSGVSSVFSPSNPSNPSNPDHRNTFRFTARAENSLGGFATREFTLSISMEIGAPGLPPFNPAMDCLEGYCECEEGDYYYDGYYDDYHNEYDDYE